MKKSTAILLAALSAAFVLPNAATARDRYGDPGAIVVSPDLSAPWVMQLQRTPQFKIKRKLPSAISSQSVIIVDSGVRRVKRSGQRQVAPVYNSGVIKIDPQGRTLAQPLEQQVAFSAPKRLTKKQAQSFDDRFLPQEVSYDGPQKAGTIVIDTDNKYLYLVGANGMARRYGVGVGKEGFLWHGTQKITNKKEWPDWRPPAEMIKRVREKEGRELPVFMAGGPENPLGARAMYLGATQYRIHGTNQPWTIGSNVSSGCIRLRNEDVVDLYERVKVGTTVVVQ
jgi:lipoprotein-anchoring transpeptidase ErfK/SrfK